MSRCDTSHSLFANSDICNSVWLCTHRKRRGSYFNKGRSLVATVTVKRTEHAARQAGRQAGRILIHPTWIQVNPWLNLHFHTTRILHFHRVRAPAFFSFYYTPSLPRSPLPICVWKCVLSQDQPGFVIMGTDHPGNWVYRDLRPRPSPDHAPCRLFNARSRARKFMLNH